MKWRLGTAWAYLLIRILEHGLLAVVLDYQRERGLPEGIRPLIFRHLPDDASNIMHYI